MSEWSRRRVVVTGSAGFVGAWLAAALVEQGAEVVCPVLDGPANLELVGVADRVGVVRGDLVELAFIEEVLSQHRADTCFHLAAQAIVGVANESPLPTLESNVCGTWNVLEACRRSRTVRRVVVASSDKAYGDQEILPYTEDLPLNAVYPYDASKACADILARSYAHTYGLPVAVTRMANIYGGGDVNWSRIVPGTIRSLLLDEDPIVRSDGTPVRDYLHVDDAVAGYLILAETLPQTAGEAFNFGANAPISALALVALIAEVAGKPDATPRIMSETKLHGEIDRQYLDSSKAERVLGWRAHVGLHEGLARTIAWYRAHTEALVTA